MLFRVAQGLFLLFSVQITVPHNGNIVSLIMSIPGAPVDILICACWLSLLINEKIGEKWGLGSYILLGLGVVAISYVRLVLI